MELSDKKATVQLIDERLIWVIFVVLISLFSCDNSSSSEEYSGITGTLENMPILPETHEYAMWLEENGNVRLVTDFQPGDDKIFRLATAPQSQIIADSEEIYVTIEEKDGGYTEPSTDKLITSIFTTNDEASISTSPLTHDFSSVAGSLIFTNNGATQGLAFQDADNNSTLQLPELNAGWHYALWTTVGGMEVRALALNGNEIMNSIDGLTDVIGNTLKIGVESDLFLMGNKSLGMYVLEIEVMDQDGVQEFNTTLENLPMGVINKEK